MCEYVGKQLVDSFVSCWFVSKVNIDVDMMIFDIEMSKQTDIHWSNIQIVECINPRRLFGGEKQITK